MSASLLAATPPDACDHSAAIKAEIEAAVRALVARVSGYRPSGEEWEPTEDIVPQRVELGYTVAMHRGRDLYRDGDTIAGLPVVIDRYASRSIAVYAGEVEFEREVWVNEGDDDGDETFEGYRSQYTEEDVWAETVW